MSDKPLDNHSMYGASRHWLVPYLLLILRNMTLHGYDLMNRLAEFGINTVDQGTIYRTLRQLEKDGHVASSWENSDIGPSRRVYSITDLGVSFLGTWSKTMGFYQNMIGGFVDFYQATLTGNIYRPVMSTSEQTEKTEQADSIPQPEGETKTTVKPTKSHVEPESAKEVKPRVKSQAKQS